MLWETLLAIVFGILCGTFTGLVPGIHVNLLAALVVTNLTTLSSFVSAIPLGCFLIAMAITHTFVDCVPSIYLGAPDEALADAALPGHKLLLCGRGYDAIRYTIVGSLGSALMSALFFVLIYYGIIFLYPIVRPYTGWILLTVIIWMVLREQQKIWALIVFGLSGALGIIVLGSDNFTQPLFPMLSGLFGVSTLLLSLREDCTFCDQQVQHTLHIPKGTLLSLLGATAGGFIAAFLPGLGSAQAGTLVRSTGIGKEQEEILILLGGINTVNFFLSLATLYAIDKARNGVIVALGEFLTPTFAIIVAFVGVCLTAGGCATIITLHLGRWGIHCMQKIPYRLLTCCVLIFVVGLVPVLSGWQGILICITATCIGLLAPLVNTSRSFGMGCLLVPVLGFFLGI